MDTCEVMHELKELLKESGYKYILNIIDHFPKHANVNNYNHLLFNL